MAANGNDAWSGARRANAAKSDGSFASVAKAQQSVRDAEHGKHESGITVRLRGGTYTISCSIKDGLIHTLLTYMPWIRGRWESSCGVGFCALPDPARCHSRGVVES